MVINKLSRLKSNYYENSFAIFEVLQLYVYYFKVDNLFVILFVKSWREVARPNFVNKGKDMHEINVGDFVFVLLRNMVSPQSHKYHKEYSTAKDTPFKVCK